MYFIVNRTKEVVPLIDLGINIGSRKAIDLEQLTSRSRIEQSSDLKKAIKKGFISVRHRSMATAPPTVPTPQANTGMTADQLREMLRQELQKIVKNPQSVETPHPQAMPDLSALMKQMAEMTEALKNAPKGSSQQSPVAKEDDDISMDRLSDIHARRVSKLAKGTEGNVSYEEKKSKDASIDDVLDALDNLDIEG
ncbi:MAG: hypothetical protein HC888_01895 [Candidatus Competibacteraceae bacterium]|nr:hypothetical protein [Candidatus Competibacteraceae bacterium]